MAATLNRRKLPKYRRPPVDEVSFHLQFQKPLLLKVPHFGLFWNSIRDQFTRFEELPPLMERPPILDEDEFWILPRVVCTNSSGSEMVQIQKDRFSHHWRKLSENDKYPSYDYVIKRFKKFFHQYMSFLEEQDLEIPEFTDARLRYVNTIPLDVDEPIQSSLSKFLPDLQWNSKKGRYLPSPGGISIQWIIEFENQPGHLTVDIDVFTDISEVNSNIRERSLKLRLSGHNHGVISSNSLWNWFNQAHEWIVLGFEDITSKDVQRDLWRKYDSR